MRHHHLALTATLALGICASQSALGQVSGSRPVLAKTIVDAAVMKAKKEKKNVLVVFHASWCGWCKRFDKFLNDPAMKPIMDRSFTYAHLDVLEDDKHKELEHPGGVDYMEKLGGKDAGLPFFAILDAKGKLIVNSMRPANFPQVSNNTQQPDPRPMAGKLSNTGHPMAPEEVAWFMEMLYRTPNNMTDKELDQIESWLKSQKKDG